MAQQITKQTLIGEMLQMDMGIAAILMAAGMHWCRMPIFCNGKLRRSLHGTRNGRCHQVLKRVNDYLANKDK